MNRLALLALLSTGCSSRKLLRLENELLKHQVTQLREQLDGCQLQAPPQDFVNEVSVEIIQEYLSRAGFPPGELTAPSVLLVPIDGLNTRFQMTIQLFQQEKVLYIAANNYLQIEDASSSKSMVLLLTQVAALNYEMLLGKFQLNPNTGAISLSVELNLDDGLGFQTFNSVVHHLVQTADARHPELMETARSSGI
ncbi:MAG: hypothetical protein P8R54_17495 [Myxococcota bacterium]|nr:hypothetical protein [Myxococcota bacterium]